MPVSKTGALTTWLRPRDARRHLKPKPAPPQLVPSEGAEIENSRSVLETIAQAFPDLEEKRAALGADIERVES